ncbi:cysteine-rich motor neuron 1 protein-like [Haliotis rufescens]|uniref:cysteine-rich motor neuron 1 protein-like n=1 Tax=Haliotis rufescens TaxID=6454 RepID=UPI00201ECF96|nr:cysteine-rich motor neuron 1 protein-like [Haliotis rufescens]
MKTPMGAVLRALVFSVLAESVCGQKQVTVCPVRAACVTDCDFGQVMDGNGCPTCTCLPRWCPQYVCPACPGRGFQTDATGCQTCACKDVCRPVRCPRRCTYGHAVNTSGCVTCQCKPQARNRNPRLPMDPDVLDTLMDMREERVGRSFRPV